MKNSKAEVRIHRHGIMTIWMISIVSGTGVNCATNIFTVSTRYEDKKFYSKADAKGCIREAIKNAPDELINEFIFYQDILSQVL